MRRFYISPENIRVKKLIKIIKKYDSLCYRDIDTFVSPQNTLWHLKGLFQIGHLPTLRYISFPRVECIPTFEWIDGFICAAQDKKEQYKIYVFYE